MKEEKEIITEFSTMIGDSPLSRLVKFKELLDKEIRLSEIAIKQGFEVKQ